MHLLLILGRSRCRGASEATDQLDPSLELCVLFLNIEDFRFELLDALICAALLLRDHLDLPLELLCLANKLSVLAQQVSLLSLNMFHLELCFFHQVLLRGQICLRLLQGQFHANQAVL